MNESPKHPSAEDVLRRYREDEMPRYENAPLVDVDQQGRDGDYPIHVTAVRGDLDDMDALIAGGADINARGELGNTALHLAAMFGHRDQVQLLLAHQAATDIRNELDDTALDCARREDDQEIIRLLIEAATQQRDVLDKG